MGRLDSDERHRYGQHYTPETVARLLAAFAIRSADDLVFDPSCGDGRLLEQALKIKRALIIRPDRSSHAREDSADFGNDQVYGLDRSAEAVELAAGTGARVASVDFFDLAPESEINRSLALPAAFDSIIGNPPYIRQELMGTDQKLNIHTLLNAGKDRRQRHSRFNGSDNECMPNLPYGLGDNSELFIPKFSGRSDIYVYFFAHAARFLKPGGRLVFITSSSWLDVDYGAPLREFMLRNFRIVAVLESAVESFFDQASVNTTISVIEREPHPANRDGNTIRFVQLCAPLDEIIGRDLDSGTGALPRTPEARALDLARYIESAGLEKPLEGLRIRLIEQRSLGERSAVTSHRGGASNTPRVSRWGRYLRADEVFFRIIERGAGLDPLRQMAGVRFGVKSGANEFFYLKQGATRNSPGSQPGELRQLDAIAGVRRGITSGANEFFYLRPAGDRPSNATSALLEVEDASGQRRAIEARYLSPIIFSLKEIAGIFLDERAPMRFFFRCCEPKSALAGSNALSYIEDGERAGYHLRPTCASRSPWYGLARDLIPAPLVFPSKVGERWVVALNNAQVFEDKKLYGVIPHEGVPVELLAALMNSTWARYYTEMTCRQMTGAQAIADIDVAVAGSILLPNPNLIASSLKEDLVSSLRELGSRKIGSLFREVELPDRRNLDSLVLRCIGFVDEPEREEILKRLYDAATQLVRARLSRSV